MVITISVLKSQNQTLKKKSARFVSPRRNEVERWFPTEYCFPATAGDITLNPKFAALVLRTQLDIKTFNKKNQYLSN
jgi:hypothetical protein